MPQLNHDSINKDPILGLPTNSPPPILCLGISNALRYHPLFSNAVLSIVPCVAAVITASLSISYLILSSMSAVSGLLAKK